MENNINQNTNLIEMENTTKFRVQSIFRMVILLVSVGATIAIYYLLYKNGTIDNIINLLFNPEKLLKVFENSDESSATTRIIVWAKEHGSIVFIITGSVAQIIYNIMAFNDDETTVLQILCSIMISLIFSFLCCMIINFFVCLLNFVFLLIVVVILLIAMIIFAIMSIFE